MAHKWLCGTPKEYCSGGSFVMADSVNRTTTQAHNSPSEAFDCYKHYLLRTGHEMIGPREFRPPDGGPILVLTKKSRFGARLREGKFGRYMPYYRVACAIISK